MLYPRKVDTGGTWCCKVYETHIEVIDVLLDLGNGHHGSPRLNATLLLRAEGSLAVVARFTAACRQGSLGSAQGLLHASQRHQNANESAWIRAESAPSASY